MSKNQIFNGNPTPTRNMPAFMLSTSMLHIFSTHTHTHTPLWDMLPIPKCSQICIKFQFKHGVFFHPTFMITFIQACFGMACAIAHLQLNPRISSLNPIQPRPQSHGSTQSIRAYVECQQIPRNLNRICKTNIKLKRLCIIRHTAYGIGPAALWNPLNGIISWLSQHQTPRRNGTVEHNRLSVYSAQ